MNKENIPPAKTKFTPSASQSGTSSYRRLGELIKEKKMASYLTLTLTFVTLSFFGLFAIRPTLITAISLTRSVSELADLKNQYENKIGDIIRAQGEYEKIRESVPLIDAALPETPSFDTLSQGLERLAQKNTLSIIQLQIEPVPLSKTPFTGSLKQYDFSLTGRGTYLTVNSYVKDLLNWKRVVILSGLDIAHDEATTSGMLRVSIKGTAYYEP
ncbi:hypothetical protein A3D77_03770 [Candidatus Gottesmanbacteria bacterium RIFCSPHIGHO2_02_FULL_39_11]|uniref:Type 4 fimbrial biogenesis protein PilO n=1 Tax=Candidatus Gottesmanbacteria bacterium RIFCSPHIGHO2_02_FULL_39_11 TaxID=1798382 RepID=A0A1F5ZY95_9BACT|nr:MAG: hypothetical protein A3D77_03770 [Candidatus Gottesmanbacteria bacterium RIFCSPHIGHO2_02_FULL_39_11]